MRQEIRQDGRGECDDKELVAGALRGQGKAFHELVDRHAGRLMGLATVLVGNAADAEDVVQETLAGAFVGLSGFRGESSVKTWLTRILIRQAAGWMRKRGRRRDAMARVGEGVRAAGPGGEAAADARMDVATALAGLSAEHRDVMVLRELEGLSYEEMAAALGVPRGTVESRLFRARRAMQERLEGYFEELSKPGQAGRRGGGTGHE